MRKFESCKLSQEDREKTHGSKQQLKMKEHRMLGNLQMICHGQCLWAERSRVGFASEGQVIETVKFRRVWNTVNPHSSWIPCLQIHLFTKMHWVAPKSIIMVLSEWFAHTHRVTKNLSGPTGTWGQTKRHSAFLFQLSYHKQVSCSQSGQGHTFWKCVLCVCGFAV